MLKNHCFIVIPFIFCVLIACDPVDTDALTDRSGEALRTLRHYIAVPGAGGDELIHVEAVNQEWTWCSDGEASSVCPVARLDFSDTGLGDAFADHYVQLFRSGRGIVSGRLERTEDASGKLIDTLRVVEVWVGIADERPTSSFYEVAHEYIYCVAAPCPSYSAALLNETDTPLVHRVTLEATGASAANLALGYANLDLRSIIVAGEIVIEKPAGIDHGDLPGTATVVAQLLYLPVP